MGAKKRSEGGKMAADDSGEQLYRAYRRNLIEGSLSMPKNLEEKFIEIRDEKNPGYLTEVVFWEYIGPDGIRALADALRDTKYMHVKSIRCWKSGTEDEGVRSICQYMRATSTVLTLELMECLMTSLSCEFLGRLLSPESSNPLLILRIDHNDIGNTGAFNIARGLAMNSVLKTLTMSYCNLDEEASRAVMQILIFQDSALQELDLQGNRFANEGSCRVLHSLRINLNLNKLNLADNKIVGDDVFMDKIIDMLTSNASLCVLDLRINSIYDDAAKDLLDRMKNAANGRINNILYDLALPDDKVSSDTIEELYKFLLPNKKTKKGKKKAKKAKK
jgi:Leucine Rich repeat